MGLTPILLWLDDMRPCPTGWIHVKTDREAREYLKTGNVAAASLDHDLGACDDCLKGMSAEEWLDKNQFQSMPHCEHFGTGYTLVCWMEETGHWPLTKPLVHSRNPVGRERMQLVINKKYDGV